MVSLPSDNFAIWLRSRFVLVRVCRAWNVPAIVASLG